MGSAATEQLVAEPREGCLVFLLQRRFRRFVSGIDHFRRGKISVLKYQSPFTTQGFRSEYNFFGPVQLTI